MFKKATKKQSLLRLCIYGPSGSGKTYSSMSIATGLSDKKVAVIDSERGSASKYAGKFNFDVEELKDHFIESYITAIRQAVGIYDVLIIDSLTHAWTCLKDENDKVAREKFRGNTWAAWSKLTPKHNRLIDEICRFPGHIIVTMRSRNVWENEGKTPIHKGFMPDQRDSCVYEFDMVMRMDVGHKATIEKDRTGVFQSDVIQNPDKKFGKELKKWLFEGEPNDLISEENIKKLQEEAKGNIEEAKKMLQEKGYEKTSDVKNNDFDDLYNQFKTIKSKEQ